MVLVKNGCVGCNNIFGEAGFSEGRCNKCKRCNSCCGVATIPYTCAWRWLRKSKGEQIRSGKALTRWENNPKVLGHNRRIV